MSKLAHSNEETMRQIEEQARNEPDFNDYEDRMITDQERIEARAEVKLLSMANDKGKFALEIGYPMEPEMQFALERGMAEWFTLIDVGPVADFPGRMFRIFKLTKEGQQRFSSYTWKHGTRRHYMDKV